LNEKTILTIDPKSLVRNAELETIVPMLSEEKFSALKYSISQFKVQVPVAIAIIDDKETVIDGYNRHKAVIQLMAEGKLPANYEIPYTMLALHQLQDAKAYSIEMNLERRQLTAYQSITWALKVFDGIKTQKEIADFLKLKTINPVKFVSELNGKIEKLKSMKSHLPETVSDSIKGLQNGTVSEYPTVLKELIDADTVQTSIDVIDDDQLRAKMDAMFFDDKYTKPSKKVLEELAIAVDKAVNPKSYDTKSQEVDAFFKDAKAFYEKSKKFRDKYPDQVATFSIATEAKAQDTVTWCKAHVADSDKKLWFVSVFEVPDFEQVS
jgi:hypothetical protein